MDWLDCSVINSTLNQVTNYNDRRSLSRLLWLLKYAVQSQNYEKPTVVPPPYNWHGYQLDEFEIRIEEFFCIDIAIDGYSYNQKHQRLNNIFLALLQVNFALYKASPTQGSISATSCAIFGRPDKKLKIVRVETTGEGAETAGNEVRIFNTTNPQTAANLIHEIGHVINTRLGGWGDPIRDTSPMGRIVRGELMVGGIDLSLDDVAYDGARQGMRGQPYMQNGGWTCSGRIDCVRNEGIADMFVHWVYEQAVGNIFTSDREGKGSARRNFWNSYMPVWISELATTR
jgi:hypothetical protein